MKVLKILLYIALGIIVFFLAAGLFAKKDYRIERSLDIKAPKSIIAEQVTCYKNFPKWSPWQDIDPNIKVSYSENDCQVGSSYAWEGNDNVGTGKITTTAITPDRMEMRVDFLKPWEATSPSFISYVEKDGVTKTTWAFDMHVGFPWNALAMFTDMDAGVGKDYEKGLARLKTLCEELAAHPKYRGYEVAEVDLPTRYYSGIRKTVAFADMGKFFEENMPKAAELTQKAGGTIAGPVAGLFWSYDETTMKSDCAAAVPIPEAKKLGGGVQVFTVAGGKAAVVDYYGPYEKTGDAHYAIDDYLKAKGLESIAPSIEEYITDPMVEKDTAKWLTKIIYLVKPKAPEMPK